MRPAPGGQPAPWHLLAGSWGGERLPASPDPAEPRWFEPLHVRDRATARRRIADQVAAGATVVVAPTWRTHRRALLPLGESRRAQEWTALAVSVTREGCEAGMERLMKAGAQTLPAADPGAQTAPAADPGGRATTPRPVTVLAVLPELEDEPDTGTGKLLPRAAAAERDHRDQAGLLADAEPDAIMVEGQSSLASARLALDAAAVTGLPTWAVAWPLLGCGPTPAPAGGHRLADGSPLQAWLEACLQAGVEAVLLRTPEPPAADMPRMLGEGRHLFGALRPGAQAGETGDAMDEAYDRSERWAGGWLAAGARIMGLDSGATPPGLASLRRSMDALEAAGRAERTAADLRWREFVGEAARMAPGGAALWLGGDATALDMPPGFAWDRGGTTDLPGLPEGRFRFVVRDHSLTAEDALPRDRQAAHIVRALDEGGILALRGHDPLLVAHPELEVVVAHASGDQSDLLLLRRTRGQRTARQVR